MTQSFDANWRIVISKGPLSYNYTLSHVVMHYGKNDSKGSERVIDGVYFPGELQFYAFNSQLYSSWTEAESRPNGVAAVSVLLLTTDHQSKLSPGFRQLTESLKSSANKGRQA